jgi:DNA-binding NarL/FixJ family response regulator
VIDDSAILRDMLSAVMSPHCGEIVTAADCAEARRRLREHRDFALVLCDVILPDGDGFQLLKEILALDPPRPDVILMTGRPDREDARRALAIGAIGYLSKPIIFRDIVEILRDAEGKRKAAPRVRRRPLGRAYLTAPAAADGAAGARAAENVWDIRDMSTSGAFLETQGPMEVGAMLDLYLDFGRSQARVQAQAVRVQVPDWGLMGGVGIAFRDFDAGSREQLVSHLAAVAAELP